MGTWLLSKKLWSFINTKTSPASFMWAHFRGLATLFNKDTLEPDLQAESVHVLADNAYCGGWAIEAVMSEARFGHIPRTGTPSITIMSLRWRNRCNQEAQYHSECIISSAYCIDTSRH